MTSTSFFFQSLEFSVDQTSEASFRAPDHSKLDPMLLMFSLSRG